MNTPNELDRLLKQCEYVSFDIFDTILLRPFWEPYDLFYFLGLYANRSNISSISPKNFVFARKEAEAEARLVLQNENIQDITLNDIYTFLQKRINVSEDKMYNLMTAEIELELLYCYPRRFGINLYKKAMEHGKKIAFISDMYLPKDVICSLLQQNGLKGLYSVYVSGEYEKTKSNGDLFQKFIQQEHLEDLSRVLHIGDNYHSDFDIPRHLGIQAFWVPSTKRMFCDNNPEIGKPMSFYMRCSNALKANIMWDDPFRQNMEELPETPQHFFGSAWDSNCNTMHYQKVDFMREQLYINSMRVRQKLYYFMRLVER